MRKAFAIGTGVCAALSLFISMFESGSANDLYHTGMLQAILCLVLWDRR